MHKVNGFSCTCLWTFLPVFSHDKSLHAKFHWILSELKNRDKICIYSTPLLHRSLQLLYWGEYLLIYCIGVNIYWFIVLGWIPTYHVGVNNYHCVGVNIHDCFAGCCLHHLYWIWQSWLHYAQTLRSSRKSTTSMRTSWSTLWGNSRTGTSSMATTKYCRGTVMLGYIIMLFHGQEVRIEKNFARGLECTARAASARAVHSRPTKAGK